MHWKTSMHVGSLVTLVAAVHYFYMREFWIQIHSSPILYRYIDWSITVPLQMIEFSLILTAVNPNLSSGMFWRLMIGTVLMLSCGSVDSDALNLVYNLADFVNKIAFCLAIWACAKASTMETVGLDDEIASLEAQQKALTAKKT